MGAPPGKLRSEDRAFDDAVEELLRIGREADLPVQISHIKLAAVDLWGQAGRVLRRLEEARQEGIEVTADVYPYAFWQSTLTVLLTDRDFHDLDADDIAERRPRRHHRQGGDEARQRSGSGSF